MWCFNCGNPCIPQLHVPLYIFLCTFRKNGVCGLHALPAFSPRSLPSGCPAWWPPPGPSTAWPHSHWTRTLTFTLQSLTLKFIFSLGVLILLWPLLLTVELCLVSGGNCTGMGGVGFSLRRMSVLELSGARFAGHPETGTGRQHPHLHLEM